MSVRKSGKHFGLTDRAPHFLLALGAVLFSLLLSGWGALKGVEGTLLDFSFRARGPRDASPRIAVVAVDDATVAYARDKYGMGWPLPRRMYGEVVRRLHLAGARTIALDVLFAEPSHLPGDDVILELECERAGNVVQAAAFQVASDPRQALPATLTGGGLPARLAAIKAGGSPRRALWAAAPMDPLLHRAPAVGHVNVFPEGGGVLRRVPHFLSFRGETFPSLALAAAAHYSGLGPQQIRSAPAGARLGDSLIPLDENSDALVNWIGGNNAHPTFGAHQILQDPDEDVLAALKDRLVLVGVTAQGAFEHRATAFSTNQPMLEFQANAVDGLVSGRNLRQVNMGTVALVALILALLCCSITTRFSWKGTLMCAPVALLLVGAGVWLLRLDWYLPLAMPLVTVLITTLGTTALGFRREWDASARSESAVVSLARGATLLRATLTTGSKDRDRLLSIIKATARETVGGREVFLVPAVESRLLGRVAADSGAPPSPLDAVARYAMSAGQTLVWPTTAVDRRARSPWKKLKRLRLVESGYREMDAAQARLFDQAELWARGGSETDGASAGNASWGKPALLVVPLASSDKAGADGRRYHGALVVAGRRDGNHFTSRDAALLEAVAEHAALAIENWEYADRLRGRMEMVNRDLEQTSSLLFEQNSKLVAAVESIDAALVVADQRGLAIFVNPASGKILRGATPIMQEPVSQALAEGDLEELAILFEGLRLQGKNAQPTRIETARGSEILLAQLTPLVAESGELLGSMLVVTDVSAQRQLDRMKTDFVGFIAHELRNPLTTIFGYASLMDQNAGKLQQEQLRQMTTVISRHCRRMNRLITDLLDISRIEAGQILSIHARELDLKELVLAMVMEARSQINPTPPLEMDFIAPDQPVLVSADSERLEQILANLLSNAVKYSPDGGLITVKLSTQGESVHLEVRDTGMGMTDEQQNRLFSKFYRTPDAAARGIKGTGLGLFLVKQLVEAHGGTIQVHSVPGRGTTISITLPANPGLS